VTTYLGYKDAGVAAAEATKAKGEAKQWEYDADWYRFLALTYRSYMGFPVNDEKGEPDKTAVDTLATLRGRYGDGSGELVTRIKQDSAKNQNLQLMKELDGKLGWDAAQKQPVKTQAGEMDRLTKELTAARTDTAREKGRADDLDKKLQSEKTAHAASKADFAKQLDDLKKQMTTDLTVHLAKITDLQKQLDDLSKTKADLQKTGDDAKNDLKRQLAKLQKDNKDLMDKQKKLEEQVAKVDRLKLDQPKGKIFRVDPSGEMPYIDLGSGDNLKPQVTFSIHGVGPDGRPLKDSKGSLEVMRIVGEHLAQARITEWKDRAADPVLPGDFLFNPAWSPTLRQRVAITGEIDLTGDDRDDLPDFLRILQQQNVIVDAYLDMKSLKVNGEITRQTDYLILGKGPELTGVRDSERKTDTIKAMTAMQDTASRHGVTVIKYKDFLALTGYQLPKPTQGEGPTYDYRRPIPAAGSAEERGKP
jgi:hypothetical protein